jgi:hypothetical protein
VNGIAYGVPLVVVAVGWLIRHELARRALVRGELARGISAPDELARSEPSRSELARSELARSASAAGFPPAEAVLPVTGVAESELTGFASAEAAAGVTREVPV